MWELERRLNAKTAPGRKTVYIRPEPWSAQYYRGSRNFMDELILGMKDSVDVVVLPRDAGQAAHYQEPQFSGVRVISSALDIADIVPHCDLFIGAGGTMTREMAVLGVPTISVYQDELLDVDRHLLEVGAFVHRPGLTAAQALRILSESSQKPASRALLTKGRAAYHLVKNTLINLHR